MDFLLALIELFSLGVTAEELRAIIGWKSAISLQPGSVDPKFQIEGVAPTNHSSSQKTRLNVLSYGVKIWTDLSSVLSGITRVTDRQTDRILISILRLHYMQRGKNWWAHLFYIFIYTLLVSFFFSKAVSTWWSYSRGFFALSASRRWMRRAALAKWHSPPRTRLPGANLVVDTD